MHTVLGFLAIIFWSTSVAFARSLTEQLGPITTAAAIFLLSGVLGCAFLAFRGWTLRRLLRLPAPYLVGCGGLFLLYEICLYLAIGKAASRQQVLVVGIINYLWPGLTLVFSLPILKQKARPLLFPGVVIAFAGVFLAMAPPGSLSWRAFVADLGVAYVSYLLALAAAVTWGLYSNFARKWASEAEGGAVPLFLLATGVILAFLRPAFPEQSHWQLRPILEVLFVALVPSLLAYVFWDAAMRRGRMILVVSFSYLTPLLSTAVSCLYLRIAPAVTLWIACALVIGGAVICRFSIRSE